MKSKVLEQITGIDHGFGTLEEPLPAFAASVWQSQSPIWKQVHGSQFVEVVSPRQACGEVDALFSRERAIPIAVVTADCVPLLLCHRSGSIVAAIHAGWRGTRARIVKQLWQRLEQQGEKAEDWVAAIGPSIGPCCYEVSEELADEFSLTFAELGKGVAVPRHRILDLQAIHARELEMMGFHQVDVIRACTKCSTQPVFHSYRREGTGVRQYSVIMRSGRK